MAPNEKYEEITKRVLWLENHWSTFNNEMGRVQESTEWLTWATRWIITGIFGNLLLTLLGFVVNLALK